MGYTMYPYDELVLVKLDTIIMDRIKIGTYKHMWDIKIEKVIAEAYNEVTDRPPTTKEIYGIYYNQRFHRILNKARKALKKDV